MKVNLDKNHMVIAADHPLAPAILKFAANAFSKAGNETFAQDIDQLMDQGQYQYKELCEDHMRCARISEQAMLDMQLGQPLFTPMIGRGETQYAAGVDHATESPTTVLMQKQPGQNWECVPLSTDKSTESHTQLGEAKVGEIKTEIGEINGTEPYNGACIAIYVPKGEVAEVIQKGIIIKAGG